MMRDIYLGIRLPFENAAEEASSRDILKLLLGLLSRLNFYYLTQHPETPALYDSKVVYTPPDQTAFPPLDNGKMQQIFSILKAMRLPPEVGPMVERICMGAETFRDIPSLYARGRGDCNELVPVRVAELWRAGIMANPYLTKPVRTPGGGLSYHAIVQWPDGSAEDPSLILGMGGAGRAADRVKEMRKNKERWDNYIKAAQHLIAAEGASPDAVADQIDLMGLLPRKRVR